jgi:hypothetical protein
LRSGAKGSHGRPVGRCRQAPGAGGQRGDGNRVPGHVEKLDGVAILGDTEYDVALDDRSDIAGVQSGLSDSRVRITSPYMSIGMAYSGTW